MLKFGVTILLSASLLGSIISCGPTGINKRGEHTLHSISEKNADAIQNESVPVPVPKMKDFTSSEANVEPEQPKGCVGVTKKILLALADAAGTQDSTYRDIDGGVKSLATSKSLCDILLDSGKPVGLYEFVSIDSKDTEKQIENIRLALGFSKYRMSIQHFIIISGSGETGLMDQAIAALTKNSPDAKIYKDDGNRSLNAFAKMPDNFDVPTLVTMAASMKALSMNDNADGYLDIVKAAEGLLTQELPQITGDKTIFEIDSTLVWDGLEHAGTAAFDIITVR